MHDSRPDPNSPVPRAVTTSTYDQANQQLAFGSLTQTFDANGNLLTQTDGSGTTTYTWDARNRLVGISGPTVSATFAYDALGRRVSKHVLSEVEGTVNGATTTFLYDGLDIVGESSGGDNVTYLRTLAIDEALTRTDSSGTATYLADILGSPVALVDGSGTPVTSYTYEPFGRTESTGTPSPNPFQFTARENDETGLYYHRARYLQPIFARFLAEDPLGILAGVNAYAYLENNPLLYRDPLGLQAIEKLKKLLAGESRWTRAARGGALFYLSYLVDEWIKQLDCGELRGILHLMSAGFALQGAVEFGVASAVSFMIVLAPEFSGFTKVVGVAGGLGFGYMALRSAEASSQSLQRALEEIAGKCRCPQ